MRFCEKLILLRKRKGMTQEEFSRAVGVSRQSVYKWESGQSYPEAAKLLEIRRLFDVSIDHMLDESVVLPILTQTEKTQEVEKKQEILSTPPTNNKPIVDDLDEKSYDDLLNEIILGEMPKEASKQETVKVVEREKKEEEIKVQAPRPSAPTVSVQKKKKKPGTIKEIVSAFFGKRR